MKTENTCQWFITCERKAVTTREHPILGRVPICQRCDNKMTRIEAKTKPVDSEIH